MPVLEVERCDGYAVLTLNRPEAMNALSRELRSALARTVDELERDPGIRVLILTGAGDRAFSAGLDLKELGAGASIADAVEVEDPVRSIARFSGPVIGAINGVAITGGFELALACDVLIAADTARFADTHARVGIMPAWGLSQKLSRAIGVYRAKELSLTGNFLSAAQAEAWGVVNRVVEPAELVPTALALAEDMAQIETDMLVTMKALIDDGYAVDLAGGLALEHERSSAHNALVTPQMVEDRRAAVQARARKQ